jgi:hypothetical protein
MGDISVALPGVVTAFPGCAFFRTRTRSTSKQSNFRSRRPNYLPELFHILLGKMAELFTTKKLSHLLQSRFCLMNPGLLCGTLLISLLPLVSCQGMSQVSGFPGISTKCGSARVTLQSKVKLWDDGREKVRWTFWIGQTLFGKRTAMV